MATASMEDITLIRRIYESIFGGGQLGLIDSLISADFVDHSPARGMAGTRDGFRQTVQAFHTAFPDFHVVVDQIIGEGESIAVRVTMSGTHRGTFMGIAPTNRAVSFRGMNFVRVRNGKLSERWGISDLAGLMGQLTAPAQPQTEVEKNMDLIVRYFEAIWNRGEFEREPEFVAQDIVVHQSPIPGLPDGIAGPLQIVGTFRAAIPDIRVSHTVLFGEGDKVVHRFEARGHHTAAPLFSAGITDKEIVMHGINTFRIANGRIAERWGHMDILGLLQQLGLAPSN